MEENPPDSNKLEGRCDRTPVHSFVVCTLPSLPRALLLCARLTTVLGEKRAPSLRELAGGGCALEAAT